MGRTKKLCPRWNHGRLYDFVCEDQYFVAFLLPCKLACAAKRGCIEHKCEIKSQIAQIKPDRTLDSHIATDMTTGMSVCAVHSSHLPTTVAHTHPHTLLNPRLLTD